MAERTLAEMLDDLRLTQQVFLDILSRADEHILYRRPADGGWTLAETLAHIAEARQFFSEATRRVRAAPGTKMGRTVEHPGRLQNIEDHGHDAPNALRSRLIASHESLLKTLGEMTNADLRIQGEHVKYGPQMLSEFIERFVVEHDQVHVEQATALLTGDAP
ncbi:MAG TPA: DinB family protein [Anaerolineae bacterium]|nr:DinB family protein [Anaerolineae bacterium]